MRDSWQLAEGTIAPLSSNCQVDSTAQIPVFTETPGSRVSAHTLDLEHGNLVKRFVKRLLFHLLNKHCTFLVREPKVPESGGTGLNGVVLSSRWQQVERCVHGLVRVCYHSSLLSCSVVCVRTSLAVKKKIKLKIDPHPDLFKFLSFSYDNVNL